MPDTGLEAEDADMSKTQPVPTKCSNLGWETGINT